MITKKRSTSKSSSILSSGGFDDHSVEANNPSRKSRPDRRGDLLDTILKKSNVSKRKLSPRPDKSPTTKQRLSNVINKFNDDKTEISVVSCPSKSQQQQQQQHAGYRGTLLNSILQRVDNKNNIQLKKCRS